MLFHQGKHPLYKNKMHKSEYLKLLKNPDWIMGDHVP